MGQPAAADAGDVSRAKEIIAGQGAFSVACTAGDTALSSWAEVAMETESKGEQKRVVVTWNEAIVRMARVARDLPPPFQVYDSQGRPREATAEEVEAITDKMAPPIDINKYLRQIGVLAEWEEIEDKPPPDLSG